MRPLLSIALSGLQNPTAIYAHTRLTGVAQRRWILRPKARCISGA